MSLADLIARLERGAQQKEQVMENALEYAVVLKKEGYVDDAKQTEQRASRHRQHAAELRAAAAAVRLVAECREALAAIRNEVSAGCHPDAPVEELKTGIHYEPVLVVDTVIEKIAEWEGKHV